MAKALESGATNQRSDMDEQERTLNTGDIVSDLEPNELVEIRRVVPFGSKTLIEGVTLQSRREVRRPLSAAEIASVSKVRSDRHSFDGDPQTFLLGAEGERIRIAHQTKQKPNASSWISSRQARKCTMAP